MLISLNCFTLLQAQDLYDLNHTKAFANYLYSSKQFNLAITEYERVLFYLPTNDSIKLSLIQSYYYANHFKDGVNRANRLYAQKNMPESFALLYSKFLIKTNDLTGAEYFLKQSSNIANNEKWISLAAVNGFKYDWSEAKKYNDQVSPSNAISIKYDTLINTALAFHKKSPFLAGAMSAMIPGSGKVYTGYWKDGLISFFMIAGSGLQAYKAFESKGSSSAKGWIFGSIATGFYLGNIYGSQKSAKDRNLKRNVSIKEKIEAIFFNNY